MEYICKERNKSKGTSNFKAWKKIIDLVLIENYVMKFVEGKVPNSNENSAQ